MIKLPIRGSSALVVYKLDCLAKELKQLDKRAVVEIEYTKELTTIEVNQATIYAMIKMLVNEN